MYMNDELVMSPSFPFQIKKYEETIMNVHELFHFNLKNMKRLL